MRNHDFVAFLKIIFLAENECGRLAGAEWSRVLKPDKKLALLVELLVQPLSQKSVFENLGPESPPPLKSLHFSVASCINNMYIHFNMSFFCHRPISTVIQYLNLLLC